MFSLDIVVFVIKIIPLSKGLIVSVREYGEGVLLGTEVEIGFVVECPESQNYIGRPKKPTST